jgi:heme/copper-type cytochrome/quinol oxidase subunit 3
LYCFWELKNVCIKDCEKHPFHLVDPSPWPLSTALASLNVTLGFVLWFHGFYGGLEVLHFGLLSLTYFLFFWFRDLITESSYQGHHTRKVIQGLKYGMLLFLVSETMFFFSFFFAYFYYSVSPSIWIGGVWPPKGFQPASPCTLAAGMTILLLFSGVTLTKAHSSLIVGNWESTIVSLVYTLLLSSAFSLFQYWEYKYCSFHMNDSVYGSIFFMITGFHGFHVIIGSVFVLVCLKRVLNGKVVTFTRQHHFGFLAALWYWHFVDVVWLFVYFVLYVWGPWGTWLTFRAGYLPAITAELYHVFSPTVFLGPHGLGPYIIFGVLYLGYSILVVAVVVAYGRSQLR